MEAVIEQICNVVERQMEIIPFLFHLHLLFTIHASGFNSSSNWNIFFVNGLMFLCHAIAHEAKNNLFSPPRVKLSTMVHSAVVHL